MTRLFMAYRGTGIDNVINYFGRHSRDAVVITDEYITRRDPQTAHFELDAVFD